LICFSFFQVYRGYKNLCGEVNFSTFAQATQNKNKTPLGDFGAFLKDHYMEKILIIGAAGQLGSELTRPPADQHGGEQVIATDLRDSARLEFDYCRFEVLDAM